MTTVAAWPLVDDDDTACMDCSRILPPGTPYSARLTAIDPVIGEILELVCVYCALSPAEYAPNLPR